MKTDQKTEKAETVTFYKDNYAHINEELKKLDLLIQLRILVFRMHTQAMCESDVSPNVYISHEEVDQLLKKNNNNGASNDPELQKLNSQLQIMQYDINNKVSKSLEKGIFLALAQLAAIFVLSPFDVQVLIICLAPELNRKYDKLYAYLQDDITRKKPSIDLVLNLLLDKESEQWNARMHFSDNAPLFRNGILQITDDPHSPSGSSDLARFLKLDPRILNYLLGNNTVDGRLVNMLKVYNPLPSMDKIMVDHVIKTKLLNGVQHHFSEKADAPKRLVFYFYGPYGVGKRDLALGICGKLNCLLLYLDMAFLIQQELDFELVLRLALREGLLMQAPLFFDNVDCLFKDEYKSEFFVKKLAKMIDEYGWLTFLSGESSWPHKGNFESVRFHSIEITVPDAPLREEAWKHALERLALMNTGKWARELARRFRLTPGQILDAADFVEIDQSMHGEQREITLSDLFAACRCQSNQKLSELSLKIEPRYDWRDIILPEDKIKHLKEICNQIKHHYQVFGEWGFDRKISHGKGLSALFSGPPGTGKTMAAEIIAHELQLDLYKIDLSGVVSKYIGETEKNLSKIFKEAEASNAILFFDEADALFGKRTEVSDAHDRYANIETSYLLQKMEEYQGIVILATNLQKNMDEAFTRRIRFIVEFPFPDETSRLRIWKTLFPKEAPLREEIDYESLSKHFKIAGGNIKNIALNAAFLAAEDNKTIGMEHILHGIKREFEKMGKFWIEDNNLYKSIRDK